MDESSLAHSGHRLRPDAHEEVPHFCYDGWVFLGYEGVDEDGEYGQDIERVPCRRCNVANESP